MGLAGGGVMESLQSGFSNPFAGLAIGIFATAIMQSSSATTSLVVTMVGAGQMSLACGIPIVMGANVGSTITCTMVAMAHVGDRKVFSRVLACSNVHDIFNMLVVAILFPTEVLSRQYFGVGFLEYTATYLTQFVSSGASAEGVSFMNPIALAVDPTYEFFMEFFKWLPLFVGGWKSLPALVFSLALILVSLVYITTNMRVLMAGKMEVWLNKVLKQHGYVGIAIGALITMIVQSSSITTSLLVPMYAAGVLNAYAAFPLLLGANIGTTITGLLASTVCNSSAGVTVALVHTLFNVCGVLIFYPLPFMRKIPIYLSHLLATLIERNRIWAFVFVAMMFFIIPGSGILIWRDAPAEGQGIEKAEGAEKTEDSGIINPKMIDQKVDQSGGQSAGQGVDSVESNDCAESEQERQREHSSPSDKSQVTH